MKLEINGKAVDDDLTEENLDRYVSVFADGEPSSFIILSSGAEQYVQASKNSDGSFVLERRDGSEEEHWTCSDEYISVERLRLAFKSYFQGSQSWPQQFSWTRLWEKEERTSGIKPLHVALVGAAVFALVWVLKKTLSR
jgi:hypothetical protein